MTLKEYVFRQIAKTNKKKYENYVVTRIIHLVNDLSLKFVTQQCVTNENGKWYLSDLYFPQLNIFIEVDEVHHLKNEELDKIRDADFEVATGGRTIRICVSQDKNNEYKEFSIEKINIQIDEVVLDIKKQYNIIKKQENFIPWDIENEYDPNTWIEQGYIDVADKVAFRTIVDACRCMGLNYNGYYRAGAKHPYEENTVIWFPKLYENKNWNNSYDDIEHKIVTKNKTNFKKHVESVLNDKFKRRIVFAHVKDNLGDIKYRFRGVFELSIEETNETNGVVWKRVNKRANTYSYKNIPTL